MIYPELLTIANVESEPEFGPKEKWYLGKESSKSFLFETGFGTLSLSAFHFGNFLNAVSNWGEVLSYDYKICQKLFDCEPFHCWDMANDVEPILKVSILMGSDPSFCLRFEGTKREYKLLGDWLNAQYHFKLHNSQTYRGWYLDVAEKVNRARMMKG